MLKLNLGSGPNKLEGYVNIDVEESCKPDLQLDFITSPLPYKDGEADEVILFHCIEHIRRIYHEPLLKEIWRVLAINGLFYVSYPEFTVCYQNWQMNKKGLRSFWEATMFGRQLFPSDYHVCPMHTPDFLPLLKKVGFTEIHVMAEPTETHNTVIKCVKGPQPMGYEDIIRMDMEDTKIVRRKL